MSSGRAALSFRIGFSAVAAVLLLAGASLNAGGREEGATALAAASGLLAMAAGASFRWWRPAAPLAAAALILAVAIAQFNARQGDLVIQLGGLVLLALGGALGMIAYRSFAGELQQQAGEAARLTAQLGMKHQAFVAATSDMNGTRPGIRPRSRPASPRTWGPALPAASWPPVPGRGSWPQPQGL